MANTSEAQNEFLMALNALIEKNIANEQFGVAQLADEMNMSRSNLLRKVKKETNLSVTQLISEIRLKRAMELLTTTSMNVSEVSLQVGFNSTSYFIKCFREYYGYPPGEAGKRKNEPQPVVSSATVPPSPKSSRGKLLAAGVGVILLIAIAVWLIYKNSLPEKAMEKSIVVLPFKNESNDSTNVYLINGLMESTLNNLQKIEELKVISRTSAEKYRNTSKSIPEIAKELGVNYFVEGSGQKIGDRILLNIQLIDAASDKHLWAKQYRRESKEIFQLQEEIAEDIAKEIEVIISPEEKRKISKKPTENLEAYDNFLKGKDLFYETKRENLEASIPYFKRAIELDPEFSVAYATAAMVFYYLDIFQADKKYAHEVTLYADKAMLYDPRSGESLVAKALDYANKAEYAQALPYFEKALQYNPHNGIVLHFLVEFYSIYIPNPRKHLQYAILKLKNDIPVTDSATAGFNYFHVSAALFETGFIKEATTYIDKSIAYDPKGFYSGYFKVILQYIDSENDEPLKQGLIKEWKKDTTRFDIMQEIGKICFMQKQYKEAYRYYKPVVDIRKILGLDLFQYEDLRFGMTYIKMGYREEGDALIKSFFEYAKQSQTIYKNLHFAMYYAALGNTKKAVEHMTIFSREDNFHYVVLLLPGDPLVESIKDHKAFKKAMQDINDKFWKTHEEIADELEENPLPQ
jgi:TolB-like protein/AraC-like DNA-binding protein